MPQLPREVVKVRAARLREAAAQRRKRWLDSLIGTEQQILIENNAKGHADNFAPVKVEGTKRGDLITARMTQRDGDQLVGVCA
jgi:threonylcarbamoyladenosine tRNA methylthiotransferase MtaB